MTRSYTINFLTQPDMAMGDLLGREDLLKPVVIAAAERRRAAPQVPTFRDIGYDVVEGNFRGFVARSDSRSCRACLPVRYAR